VPPKPLTRDTHSLRVEGKLCIFDGAENVGPTAEASFTFSFSHDTKFHASSVG
jgi:hypothetical protein